METAKLKKFAQFARRSLMEQVLAKFNFVLAENSAARRECVESVKRLEDAIKKHGKEQVIERVAYTWFNRFCALRFMDVNRYTRIGVVSPADEQFQPEILAEAKMGHIDDEMVSDTDRKHIFDLLDGKVPSHDSQAEAYRLLVVAACNFFHRAMPYLFQRIDDYTELLMPEDLLSAGSILAVMREAMALDDCKDVEVIGWLYQFYISEKKDEVFDGLKKNKKITPENIPAATQLFTPHWIVRYLVENSLGRLWLLNRPSSKLALQMDYYIKTEQEEVDFLRINKPEEIKICDPACGSGHMLTYAFDLLYAIYEEEGYEPSNIAEKILTYNLYGIEIDERAGELASFALTMKARAKQRRFFNKGIKPNICVLENIQFHEDELNEYMDFIGRDLFTSPLQSTLHQFEEADNFGSLIRPKVTDIKEIFQFLEEKHLYFDWIYGETHYKVLQALRQIDYLSPKYYVVIANPPYMGGKGMNARLGKWAKENFPNSKTDLFSIFIERMISLVEKGCFMGFMTPFTWMFLSSYEKLRSIILDRNTLTTLVRPEYHAFFESAYVPICAFTLFSKPIKEFKGSFIDLQKFYGSEIQAEKTLYAIKNPDCGWLYKASSTDLKKITGFPIAYWVSARVREIFRSSDKLAQIAEPKQGLITGDNNKFIRIWNEVSINTIALSYSVDKTWYPLNKGGEYRKWHGNQEHVVLWKNDGYAIKNFKDQYGKLRSRPQNLDYNFTTHISWSLITSGNFSVRSYCSNFTFNVAGISCFPTMQYHNYLLGLLNTKIANSLTKIINPTLNSNVSDVGNLPIVFSHEEEVNELVHKSKLIAESDWNSYETSWNFTTLPLLNPDYHQPTLKGIYQKLRAHWMDMTMKIQQLEEENNRIFILAYGLQEELTPEVPLNEITLICNPYYRYGNGNSDEDLEVLLLADTMRELISYAVGCMFGRYALEKQGLILANQGETIDDYQKQIPNPSFSAVSHNVIPMLGGDWFSDDIAYRFCKFIRLTFGEKHYEENLKFIEQSLNIKGRRNYSIRDYFLSEFYSDHVKRYKKRPIYWLFSSPKESFNALIYMHRYRPDTVSVVLNDYLREFRAKLTAHKNRLEAVSISVSASQSERTKALKEIEKTGKMIIELEEYERDVLYPLATKQVVIDLDDGVKVNYPKFGSALKFIKGLTDE